MGFIESRKIEDIFDRIKPSIEMKVKTTADWIATIDQLFEEQTIQIDFDEASTFQMMNEALSKDQMIEDGERSEILRQLGLLNLK